MPANAVLPVLVQIHQNKIVPLAGTLLHVLEEDFPSLWDLARGNLVDFRVCCRGRRVIFSEYSRPAWCADRDPSRLVRDSVPWQLVQEVVVQLAAADCWKGGQAGVQAIADAGDWPDPLMPLK